jgi:polyhydroxybutyrate depolymerase
MGDRGQVGLAWTGAVALILCAAAACTTAGHMGRSSPAQPGGPGVSPQQSNLGSLIDRPIASTGCGHRAGIQPGTTAQLTVAVPPARAAGASHRSYWLHVPHGYSASRLTPLVLAFHGGGGTALGMERTSDLSAASDRRGFLVAYPQGLRQDHGRAPPGWDASGPRDPFADGIDDGLYVSHMLSEIQASYCIDPRRIWATGISNGGSMVGYLACVLSDRIAAFAPVEGVFFQIPGGCHPGHPAAILDVHVRTDPVAPYAGVPARGSPDYYALAIPAWLREWASRDSCSMDPEPVPAEPGMTGEAWTHCPAGVSVAGDLFPAGGHTWFRSIGPAAGDNLVLGYFRVHPLRSATPSWVPRSAPPVPLPLAPMIAIRSMRVFRLPEPGAEPFDIAQGADGAMWFTEFASDKIGRISLAGVITQFSVPTASAGPYQITAGPHGTMWFTEYNTRKVGRVTSRGRVTEFMVPPPSYGPAGITGSGTGPVYAADPTGFVDTIPADGPVSPARLSSAAGLPFAIARLPSGILWISELKGYFEYSRHLLSFAPRSGKPLRTITLPDPLSNVVALAAGPVATGAMWFADFGTGNAGEVSPDGRLSFFPVGTPASGLSDIAAGPDGAMWVSAQDGIVARVTPRGAVSELALPAPGSNPDAIAAGPNKSIWVTETGSDAIVEISLG